MFKGRAARAAFTCALFLAPLCHAQSPVAYWTFSNQANLGADSSGNNYNLTAEDGTVGFDKNALGGLGAAVFSGSDYFDLNGNFPGMLPTGNSSYTITAWIDPGAITAGSYGIIGWGLYESNDQVNAFRTDANGGIQNYSWADDAIDDPPGFNVYDGNWHFVAVTYDATTGNRFIYIDPTSGPAPFQSNPANPLNVQSTDFTVGRTCLVCTNDELFQGEIGQLQVFNSALTAAQIDALAAPEPGTAMLAIPVIGLMWLRRRSARRSALGSPE